jgi:RNA polymerase sigma-70 factor (ECF subfamily)
MPGRSQPAAPPIEDWIEKARQGSAEALWQLLDHYRLYLLAIAEAELEPALRPRAGASDLVHNALVSAQAAFGRFRGRSEGELQGWLRTILLNNLANLRRRPATAYLNEKQMPHASGQVASPIDQVIRAEETGALDQALARLPELSRQVVHWRQWEERSFEEIGQLLGKSADAARKIWSRAVQQLQREMNKAHGRR